MKKSAGNGPKWLDVSAERFPGWISSFARRHGDSGSLGLTLADRAAAFTAPDGAVAECHPPFPESFAWSASLSPLIGQPVHGPAGTSPGEMTAPPPGEGLAPAASPAGAAALIAVHAREPRAVGVLLVRLGGYAAGVFTGYPPVLADAKTGSRLVHGRSAAGGWSQQRFARRREKQANEALDAAAGTALMVFGRWESGITASSAPAAGRAHGAMGGTSAASTRSGAGKTATGTGEAAARGRRLDAVVLGGDKRAAAELRDDPRLARYLDLATERFLTVPDPKRAVLEATPGQFAAVRIRLTEP
ncbi:MAG TPA: Vms1/Ankzf1 family peptidyl-tRNA hydrolase [Trebonia sp.]